MLKVVFDTNMFVSGLLVKSGPPARALDAWRERRYVVAISPAIISEIRAVLNYARIRRKYAVTDGDVSQLAALLEGDALLVPGSADVAGSVPDDPADEKILACAVEARADLVVTGDHHLLDLREYKGIAIVTVYEFLERLSGNTT